MSSKAGVRKKKESKRFLHHNSNNEVECIELKKKEAVEKKDKNLLMSKPKIQLTECDLTWRTEY